MHLVTERHKGRAKSATSRADAAGFRSRLFLEKGFEEKDLRRQAKELQVRGGWGRGLAGAGWYACVREGDSAFFLSGGAYVGVELGLRCGIGWDWLELGGAGSG